MTDSLRALREELPVIVFRKDPRLKEWLGISANTLRLYDQKGQGPKGRIKIGSQVAYSREGLIQWMEARIRHEG